ncbi:MAG: hypothetical protein LC775_04470, partial [Acidobacteria bacterium]|nr:hypothetical protein [Acidobacteriota bacterium]
LICALFRYIVAFTEIPREPKLFIALRAFCLVFLAEMLREMDYTSEEADEHLLDLASANLPQKVVVKLSQVAGLNRAAIDLKRMLATNWHESAQRKNNTHSIG